MNPCFNRRLPHGPCTTSLPLLGLLICLAVCLVAAGCNRVFYRTQADAEVYTLVDCAAVKTPGAIEPFTIAIDPESRMYEPGDPDLPPMPPDDPVSHELMQCVDGMGGWPSWDCYGNTNCVQNPDWASFLSSDEEGKVILDRYEAVQLALLESPDYQRARENLYLSALDVTFQRFRFDAQFFGGYESFFTTDGPDRAGGPLSILKLDNNNSKWRVRKLFASGGELVVGMANSLMWQFAGPNTYQANSLLDFSLVQPLLRAGGRAVVLATLTDSERSLLANIRQMERYRRAFYVRTVAGVGTATPPSAGGVRFTPVATTASRGAGGFFGILRQRIEIRNQRSNVAGLRDSLDRMQAIHDEGLLSSYQVDFTAEGLYRSQTRLLQISANYERTLDQYKLELGLPPDLPITIDDPMLSRFDLIDPQMMAARVEVADGATALRVLAASEAAVPQVDYVAALCALRQTITAQIEAVGIDLARLETSLPQRCESLRRLALRDEAKRGDIEPTIYSIEALNERAERLHVAYDEQIQLLAATLSELEVYENDTAWIVPGYGITPNPDKPRTPLHDLQASISQLSQRLLGLSLIQARARLDTIMLSPIDITPPEALDIARTHRRDWMNARAALVDTWRQIEVMANALESDVDLVFSGELGTKNNKPLRFRGTTGQLRVGVRFDAPLTRLTERNAYRRALISYQQTRREYYTFEDRIDAGLRDTVRTARLNELDFEVQRSAVSVAISQVDFAQEALNKPGRGVRGATTARDLVDALASLLNAQNSFLSIWVDEEALRMDLDLNLGTMQLDDRGMWIDPGTIRGSQRPDDGEGDLLNAATDLNALGVGGLGLDDLQTGPALQEVPSRAAPLPIDDLEVLPAPMGGLQ